MTVCVETLEKSGSNILRSLGKRAIIHYIFQVSQLVKEVG